MMRKVMKKGFLHVVEVIIVALLIFVILAQFYSIPSADYSWERSKLIAMSQDLLYTMDELDVDWLNASEVADMIKGMIPGTVAYSLKLDMEVNPDMKVGCVCTPDDYATLQAWVLTDFTLNGIERGFSIALIEPGTLNFDIDGPHLDNDVLIFWGVPTEVDSAEKAQNLSTYLSMGNGIVEYANLTEADVADTWHNGTFSLVWVSESESEKPGSAGPEFPYFDPSEAGYMVQKIFMNLPPALSGFTNFDNLPSNENVYPADGREKRILVSLRDQYSGGAYNGKSVPLSVLNWGVMGRGRTAWMTGADLEDMNGYNRRLLKSLVSWAASGKGHVLIESLMKSSVTASMRKVFNEAPGAMYEPVRIDLTLGYHY
jgi:hypothetical protein